MKIAIVGTTKLTANEKIDMRYSITNVLQKYSLDSIIISGGAQGVDALALDVANELGFQTKAYMPQKNEWKYYKKRNLQIAQDCDELYCFSVSLRKIKCYHHDSPQDHEKTAGCWTSNQATQLGKACQLVVIPNRD